MEFGSPEFSIKHIKSFATLRICSTDVTKSRDWYRQLFQLEPIEDLENFVSFKIGDVALDIAQADGKSPSSTGGSVGYWFVDDLDAAIAKAVSIGGVVFRGPLKVEEIKRTIVQIKDPCGNVIGFECENL